MQSASWSVTAITEPTRDESEQLSELRRACHAVDQPDAPPPHRGDPIAVVRDEGGAIIAELGLRCTAPGSRSHASLHIAVLPTHRRRGVGSALMEHAVRIAGEEQQASLMTIVHQQWPDGPVRAEAGSAFVQSHGFDVGNIEVRSRAALTPVEAESSLADKAQSASQDFDTVRWVGHIPEEFLIGAAALHTTFSTEIPRGRLQPAASQVTPDQLRRQAETAAEQGTFRCGVLALHRPTRRVVGSTFIIVPRDEPADQRITLVSPDCRGHRLSMRLKIDNLRQLRELRPDVSWVWTENAESNAPMRRVNEQLGFAPVDYAIRYLRML